MKQLAFGRPSPFRALVGLMIALAIGPPAAIFGSVVWAQGAAHDETGALTATATEATGKTPIEKQFAGTSAELDTYVGTGTFYRRYSDPYVSNGLYPQTDLPPADQARSHAERAALHRGRVHLARQPTGAALLPARSLALAGGEEPVHRAALAASASAASCAWSCRSRTRAATSTCWPAWAWA